jgi:predicted dehydrogenase
MRTIPQDRPIHVAFLGCGDITKAHSKTLRSFKSEVRLFYASRDEEKSMRFNAKYNGGGSFGSYEGAIQSPDIDVVLVATPPSHHLELTLAALQAGKHVIVEKPPFLRSSDFDAVEQARQETGGNVFVAENYYYKPLAFRLREILRSDMIGDVLFLHVNATKLQKTGDWRDKTDLAGGGSLFEGGIHLINLLSNLGLTPKSAGGLKPSPKGDIERSMLVTVDYEEGGVATLLYSWEVPALFKGLRISQIFGREGSITFETNGLFAIVWGRHNRLYLPGFKDIKGFHGMFRDFFHSIRTGEDPQFDLRKARRDVELIEAAYNSVRG